MLLRDKKIILRYIFFIILNVLIFPIHLNAENKLPESETWKYLEAWKGLSDQTYVIDYTLTKFPDDINGVLEIQGVQRDTKISVKFVKGGGEQKLFLKTI